MRRHRLVGERELRQTDGLRAAGSGRVTREGTPAVVVDVHEDPEVWQGLLEATGAGPAIFVPLLFVAILERLESANRT